MKKYSKFIASLGMAGTLALTACATTQQAASPVQPIPNEEPTALLAQLEDQSLVMRQWATNFPSISGTLVDVTPADDGIFYIINETSEYLDDITTTFFININTMFVDEEPAVGDEIKIIIDAYANQSAYAPAQYHARVVSFANRGVKLDRFDENFLSSDGSLFINITEGTEIFMQDATAFTGEINELVSRLLIVEYSIVAQSFPAQTTPERITVLFETAVHPTLTLTPEDLEMFWANLITPYTQIIVDGEVIEDAPMPFINRETGMIMLPAAAIAEAAGFTVVGEGEDIVIHPGITFTVGVDSYHFGRMAPIELHAPPELYEDVLFVPMQFFGMVMPIYAFIEDENVIISTEVAEEH